MRSTVHNDYTEHRIVELFAVFQMMLASNKHNIAKTRGSIQNNTTNTISHSNLHRKLGRRLFNCSPKCHRTFYGSIFGLRRVMIAGMIN